MHSWTDDSSTDHHSEPFPIRLARIRFQILATTTLTHSSRNPEYIDSTLPLIYSVPFNMQVPNVDFPVKKNPSTKHASKLPTTWCHDTDDAVLGTGIFTHNATPIIPYNLLLQRLYLQKEHFYPSLNTYRKSNHRTVKLHVIPSGRKKTTLGNFAEMCKGMNRDPGHVTRFLVKELGTSHSSDAHHHSRLVLKGRFASKQIEKCLGCYRGLYVICPECKSSDTTLSPTETRAFLIEALKTGYVNMVPKRRKEREQEREPEPGPEQGGAGIIVRGPGRHCSTACRLKAKL
ncbi:translation initiation factor IF2/IF5 [Pleomassaria siparia CBS 279.74]|uniref:Translation initiation factor IF2/IF5 n=1 Tax=Pleomassaria siparia CBS 279.74 TaxID=1314801 RepID=A0A6G1KSD8_9PLEO|nr:translation initiation factor IF2/IF5 [Pleomassaria siparia CBS 279.74]